MAGKELNAARVSKKDEFYTQWDDIAKELEYYTQYFIDKVVLCNCDDPYESNFFKYFALNFNRLGLKKLIATCYNGSPIARDKLPLLFELPATSCDEREGCGENNPKKIAYKVEITEVQDYSNDGAVNLADVQWLIQNNKNVLSSLKGNGDFRSQECIELLKEADIVVTNPPFSLFREYIAQLVKYNKLFLIIGNVNAVTYKECFKLLRENRMWLGATIHSGDREFRVPESYPLNAAGCRMDEKGNKYIRVKGVRWYTNMDYPQRHKDLVLIREYDEIENPSYANYDAINIKGTSDIPKNYYGIMGVPITFIDKYNPDQFEILDCCEPAIDLEIYKRCSYFTEYKSRQITYDGKLCQKTYHRLLIRNKKPHKA